MLDLMKSVDDAREIIEQAKRDTVHGPSQPFVFLVHAYDYLSAERDYLFEEKWKQIRGE